MFVRFLVKKLKSSSPWRNFPIFNKQSLRRFPLKMADPQLGAHEHENVYSCFWCQTTTYRASWLTYSVKVIRDCPNYTPEFRLCVSFWVPYEKRQIWTFLKCQIVLSRWGTLQLFSWLLCICIELLAGKAIFN